jgi:hypothetical protein
MCKNSVEFSLDPMRGCLLVIMCAFAASHFLLADPNAYHVSVLADSDKTEGGELATLIADDLRRFKDVVIDDKSPDLTVSCFAINLDDSGSHGVRIVASVALIRRGLLLEHFALAADSLQSLAHKVAAEVDRRELNNWRRADAPQTGLTNR